MSANHVADVPDQDYRTGRLLTGQLKARCIQMLQEFVKVFQAVCAFSTTFEITMYSYLHVAKSQDHG
jgi:tryptophanyl-tRNA synthetase